jgi:fibronectin-binding autotransporter adhesin
MLGSGESAPSHVSRAEFSRRAPRRAQRSYRGATALAGGVLALLALPGTAAAQTNPTNGGAGAGGAAGGASSTDGTGGRGGDGGSGLAGGGGGSGTVGGRGGDGDTNLSPIPGANGGSGGAAAGADGSAGANGNTAGGGGGGGAHGGTFTSLTDILSPVGGGRGGNGGSPNFAGFVFGGGGGAGGYGGVITGSGNLGSLNFAVTGGAGGSGGSGGSSGISGSGGQGGHGLVFTGSGGITATINANVSGGNGGASFATGGAGIVGSNLDLTLNAPVSSGLAGGLPGLNGRAFLFTGGSNRLTFGGGGAINGGIHVDTLSTSLSLDTPGALSLGNTISGSGSITKTGAGTLTLTGANTYSGGTTISGGTLRINHVDGLGSGFVSFADGTLLVNASGTFNNVLAVESPGTNVLAVTTGNSLTLTGGYGFNTSLRLGSAGNAGTIVYSLGSGSIDPAFELFLDNGAIVDGNGRLAQHTALITGTEIGALATLNFNGRNATINNLQGAGRLLNAGFTTTINEGSFSGTIEGTQSLTKVGAGTLVLSGANTYSGSTNVNAGLLQVETASGLGTSTINFNGGALRTTAPMTLSNLLNWRPVDTTVSAAADTTLTLTGFSTIVSDGSSHPTLRFGTASDTGTIVIDASSGALAFNNSAQQGRQTLIVQGGTLQAGTNPINNLGFWTREFGETRIESGATLDFNIHNSTIANLQGAGTLLNGATTTIEQGSFSGVIEDGVATHNLAKTGSGTLILSGNNIYTGTTTVSGGTLLLTGSIASSAGTTISGGTLQIGDFDPLVAGTGLTGSLSGNVTVSGSGNLTFDRAGIFSFANAISGNGSVTQASTGTLLLTGANTYSGNTNINAGLVQIGAANALGTSRINFNGGALRTTATMTLSNLLNWGAVDTTVSAASSTTLTLTGFSNIVSQSANYPTLRFGTAADTGIIVIDASSGSLAFNSGALQGQQTLIVQGGTLKAGANPINNLGFWTREFGETRVDAGATLDFDIHASTIANLQGAGTLLNGTTTTIESGSFSGAIVDGAATHALAKTTGGTLILSGNNSYSGSTTISGGTLQIGNGGTGGTLGGGNVVNNGSLVFNRSDTITVGNLLSGTGSLTQAGTGTVILSGANSYSGATSLQAGTLQIDNATALGTSNVTLSGGSLRSTVTTTHFNGVAWVLGSINSTMSAAPGTELTLTGFINVLSQLGPAALRFGAPGDTGTVNFNSTSGSFAGGASGSLLAVEFGTLRAGSALLPFYASRLAQTRIDAGATLDFNGASFGANAIINLQGAGTLANSGTTRIQSGDFAGTITGTGGIEKTGTGTLILAGANSYSGTTTISGGTLQIGNGGTGGTLGGGDVVNNASLIFNRSDTISVGNLISGTGRLTQAGSGTLFLSGGNTYSGGTSITAGLIRFNGGGNFGTGNITLNGGGLQWASGNSFDISSRLNAIGSGGGIFDTNGNNVTLASILSGTGAITKVGAGTLTLSGANTYSGGTFINAGTLSIGDQAALGSGGVTINSGGTLSLDGSITLSKDLTSNGGTVSVSGPSTLTGLISGSGINFAASDPTSSIGIVLQNGGNSYGTTGIGSGVFLFVGGLGGANGSLGTGDVTFADDRAHLVISGSGGQSFGNRLIGNGIVQIANGGTTTFTGSNVSGSAFTGQVWLNGGTLLVNGDLGDVDGNGATLQASFAGGPSRLGGSGTFHGNVFSQGPATIAPGNSAGTLTIAGNLTLFSDATLDFELGEAGAIGGANNDLLIVNGNLTLFAPTLNIALTGGAGYYRLINYGTLTGGASFGSITGLPSGFTGTALFHQPGVVNLRVSDGSALIQHWDGTDTTGASTDPFGIGTPTPDGGSGTWNSTLTNWTSGPGFAINDSWQSGIAVFGGHFGGTVTVEGTQSFAGLRFESDFYTLEAGAGGQLSAAAGATIDVASNISATLNLPLLSGDGLRKTGDGTLILRGTNSYSGDTSVTGGLINFADLGVFSTGRIVLDGGGLQWAEGNTTDISSRLDPIGASGGIFDTGQNDVTLAGPISGSGGITKAGAGTLTLTGANTYAGGTTLAGGRLSIASLDALGSGGLTFNGGILQTTADLTLTAPVIIQSFGTFDTVDGTSLTIASDIDGSGGLVKFGAGTFTLTGFNTYLGPTIISGGTLEASDVLSLGSAELAQIDSGARLRALADLGVFEVEILEGGGTIDTGSNTVFVNTFDFLGRLTKEGSGTLLIEDFLETGSGGGGGIDVLAGTLGLATGGSAGFGNIFLGDGTTLLNAACGCGDLTLDNDIEIAGGGTATFNGGGGTFTLNGVISGGDASFVTQPIFFSESSPSIFYLTNVNSYGDTLIGPDVALILSGSGTLGTGNTAFDPAPSSPLSPAALVFQNGSDYTYNGIISGSGIVSIEADPGVTVTLGGSNTSALNFTGTVDIVGGGLVINGAFGDVVNNSAELLISGCGCSMPSFGGSGTFHGNVEIGNAILNPGNSPGTLTIGGNLLLSSGTVLNFELGEPGRVGGPNNDLVNVGGNLRLDGTLNVTAFGPNYGPGYYRLFNYATAPGALDDQGLLINPVPGGFDATILTDIKGQVNLRLGSTTIQYWDGTDLTGSSSAATGNGGSGTWDAASTNWTAPTGYAVNDAWQSRIGVFAGAAGGTVTVAGTQAFQELRFESDNYLLRPVNGGARLALGSGFSFIDVGNGLTADVGVILEGGGLTKTGGGTLLLSGNNSYIGPTSIVAGTLRLGTNFALTAQTAVDVSAGATLDVNGTFNQVGALSGAGDVLLGTNGLFDFGFDNSSTTFSGRLSGEGSIRKFGSGTFELTGTIDLTGLSSATASNGTFTIGTSGTLTANLLEVFDTLINEGAINAPIINFGSATNNGSINGAVQSFDSFANAGTVTGQLSIVSGSASNSGNIEGDVINFATFTSTGIINGQLNNFGTSQLQGQLNGLLTNSGPASIMLTGTLTGVTRYTGASGATLDLASFDTTLGGLVGEGDILLGSATLTIDSSASATFSGVISGSGGLVKVGAGTLTLSGSNTYSGGTLLAAGTLRLENSSAAGTGSITTTGSVISYGNGVTVSNAIILASDTTQLEVLSGEAATQAGLISQTGGSRPLEKIGGGTLTLTAANSYTGLTTVSGGTLAIGSSGSLAGAVQNNATFTNAGTVTGLATNVGTLDSTGVLNGGLANSGTASLSGQVNGAVSNSGTITLTGTTTGIGAYTGDAGSTFNLNSFDTSVGSLAGAGSVELGGGTLTTGGNNGSTSFAGEISGTGGLRKIGTGTLTLGGANSYSGGTILEGGELTVGNSSALGTGAFTFGIDTSLRAGAADLMLANSVQLLGGTATIDTNGFILSLDGIVSGGGSLTKVGAGTLRLSGANTYTGTTTVSAGTLDLRLGGVLSGPVVNNATFISGGTLNGNLTNNDLATNLGTINGTVFNNGDFNQLTGAINGNFLNNGTADLAGQINGFAVNQGVLTLTGNLEITSLGQLSAGTTNLANFDLTVGALSGDGTIALGSGALTVGAGNASDSFGGIISGTGTLTKIGTGTFVLSGANTYTGITTVQAGTLFVFGSLAGAVLNDGTLANEGSIAGRVINNGLLFSIGTLSGGLTNTGTAQVGGTLSGSVDNLAGLITLSSATTGIGRVTQEAGALFDLAGFNTGFGSLSGNGEILLGAARLTVGSDNSDSSFAGIVTGSGAGNGLTKVGTGTLTLTGSNTYTGTTTVSAGTLNVGSTGRIAGNVLNNATFNNDGRVDLIVANSGTGSNGGVIGSGVINSGAFDSTGSIGTGVQNEAGGAFRARGEIVGFVVNSGTFDLTGALTGIGFYQQGSSGQTNLNGFSLTVGALEGGGGINLGTGAATLTTGDATSRLVFGAITGAGNLTKVGTGTLTLAGTNSFAGLTTVSEGRLDIQAGGSLASALLNNSLVENRGAIGGLVTNNAIMFSLGTLGNGLFNNAGAQFNNDTLAVINGAVRNEGRLDNFGTINGLVTNSGQLLSARAINGGLVNSGTVLLGGTLAGPLSNNAGTVTLGGTATGITAFTQLEGALFNLNGFHTAVGSIAGAGEVRLGSALLTVGGDNSSTTFAGIVTGGNGGLTKVGAGTLTLSGVNTYAGLTTVSAGTLALSASGRLSGNVLNNATFTNAGLVTGMLGNNGIATSSGTINGGVINDGSFTSTGVVNIGMVNRGTVLLRGQLNGTVDNLAGSITLTGATTGITTFIQAAGASLNLNGISLAIGTLSGAGTITFGGSTGSSAGSPAAGPNVIASLTTPAAMASADAPAPAGLVVEDLPAPATVALSGDAGGPSVAIAASGESMPPAASPPLARASGGAASGFGLTVTDSAQAAAAGAGMSVEDTPHAARPAPADKPLPGADLIGGGAAIQVVAAEPNLAAIADPGETRPPAVIGGGAAVTLVTAAPNLSAGPATGAVLSPQALPAPVGPVLTVGSSNLSSVFAGLISGNGRLAKVGTGVLILTGDNTYTDGTLISGGALQLGNGGTTGSILGRIENNALLFVNRSDAFTLANPMEGTGALVQNGTGTTTLTGANSYSGGTLILRGRLRGAVGALQGDIQNNSELEFAQSVGGTYAGRLSGTGSLEKTGAGLLTFTGDSSAFTGDTRLLAGELRVNSLLSRSRVTASAGTTLSGTGLVGGITAQSGATVAPGSGGIGMLGVNGNVQFLTGSTYAAQVQAAGSDLILSNGTAQLAGTLAITNGGGSYLFNSTYVLMQADGGRTGMFGVTTGLSGFGQAYAAKIVYTANQVQLVMAPNQLLTILGPTPGTPNQISTLQRIDTAVAGGYNPQSLFALYNLNPAAALLAGADALSGEIYPTSTRIVLDDERLVREAVIGRLRAVQDAEGSRTGAWGQVFGSWGSGDGDGNAAKYERDQVGFAVGLDGGRSWDGGAWRIGALGFHLTTTIDVESRASRAEVERTGGGIYAGLELGGFRARIGGTYARLNLESRRTISFVGFNEAAAGDTEGEALQGFGELAYRIDAGRGSFVEPFLLASIARVKFDAFSEAGGASALRVSEQENELTTLTVGLRGEARIGSRDNFRLGGSLGVRHASGDRLISSLIALDDAPTQPFAIRSAAMDRYSSVGQVDASFDVSDRFTISLGYSGVAGDNARDHSVRATATLKF